MSEKYKKYQANKQLKRKCCTVEKNLTFTPDEISNVVHNWARETSKVLNECTS